MERRFPESIISQSDTQHIVSKTEQRQTKWWWYSRIPPPSQSWSIHQSKTEISVFVCNTSKDPSTLAKSISMQHPPLLPPFTTQSQHHTSLSSAPACFHSLPPSKQCPRSRPFLLIVRWPCKKKQRRSLGFNYSCVMRGSGFSPLQAKKKKGFYSECMCMCGCVHATTAPFCVSMPFYLKY